MSDWKVGRWWNVSIKYVIPIVLVVLLYQQFMTDIGTPYEGYPMWALSIGWLIVLIPIAVFVLLLFTDKRRLAPE